MTVAASNDAVSTMDRHQYETGEGPTSTARDHDTLAVALNERFSELGGDHPVTYSEDGSPPRP